jgi:[ribosomal protein S18]-alanine N-acetyltransferase
MSGFLTDLFGRGPPRLSPAGPPDAAAMADLHAQAFRRGWSAEEFERLLADKSIISHRATLGRDLVGFAITRLAADEAEILSIAVVPSWRGRGIAGQMLDLQLRRLAGLGIARLFLEVDEGNEPARRLYARAQFAEVGRRGAYYHKGGAQPPAAALILRRDLA